MGKTTVIMVLRIIEQSLLNILVWLELVVKSLGSVVSLYDVVISVDQLPVDMREKEMLPYALV